MHLERHESDDEHGHDSGRERHTLTDSIRELSRALIPKKDMLKKSTTSEQAEQMWLEGLEEEYGLRRPEMSAKLQEWMRKKIRNAFDSTEECSLTEKTRKTPQQTKKKNSKDTSRSSE